MPKFASEIDPIQHVEQFEQLCSTFGNVDDLTKVGAFRLTLEGKAEQLYRALTPIEMVTFTSLCKAFIIGFAPSGHKWSPITQL